jgi:hypothetical protein
MNENEKVSDNYYRFEVFGNKSRSSFLQQWRAVNRLMPKGYRQTHDNFHLYYEPLPLSLEQEDKTQVDFHYTMFGRNRKTGIYEKVSTLILPHTKKEKGDGVDPTGIFSKSSSPMWAKWTEKLSQWTGLPGVYDLEYYPTKDALYNLNSHNADYIYKLATATIGKTSSRHSSLSALSDDESIFDRVYQSERDNLVRHPGIMEFEKKRGTLRFYLFSVETQKKMLQDKSNVFYFADESNYKLKDIYEQTDKALLDDFEVAMRFMIMGPKDFSLSEKLKNNPEFMLAVAQNQWLFGKASKINHANNKDQYCYHDPLSREDFIAFFPDFQRHAEVALALKHTLGESVMTQSELDEIYQAVIPEKYRLLLPIDDNDDDKDNNKNIHNDNAPELILNWQKRNMVTWAFQTFVKDALLNRYIQVHRGEIRGMYPANYQDKRFRDLEVSHPSIFLNTHDRAFLMSLKDDEKVCIHEMLNVHADNFNTLMDDKEFLLTQKIGNEDVKYLSDKLQCDPDIAIHAIQNLPEHEFYHRARLKDFKELVDNRDVVKAFCQKDVKNLTDAAEHLRKDKDFVINLIGNTLSQNRQKRFSGIYHYADESLKHDKDVAMFAIKHGQTLHDVPEPMKTEDLQYESLLINLYNYHFTTKEFRNKPENEELGIKAFEQEKQVYELLPDSLKKHREMAQTALFSEISLEYLSDEFKDDLDMVLIALAVDQDNYRHISERLRDDEALLMIATTELARLKEDNRYPDYLEKMNHPSMPLINILYFEDTEKENIKYASNRLQQRFGNTLPYDYLRKEEQVSELAQKIEEQYRNKNECVEEDNNDANDNGNHHRPMKI